MMSSIQGTPGRAQDCTAATQNGLVVAKVNWRDSQVWKWQMNFEEVKIRRWEKVFHFSPRLGVGNTSTKS